MGCFIRGAEGLFEQTADIILANVIEKRVTMYTSEFLKLLAQTTQPIATPPRDWTFNIVVGIVLLVLGAVLNKLWSKWLEQFAMKKKRAEWLREIAAAENSVYANVDEYIKDHGSGFPFPLFHTPSQQINPQMVKTVMEMVSRLQKSIAESPREITGLFGLSKLQRKVLIDVGLRISRFGQTVVYFGACLNEKGFAVHPSQGTGEPITSDVVRREYALLREAIYYKSENSAAKWLSLKYRFLPSKIQYVFINGMQSPTVGPTVTEIFNP